jgi:dihydrofolate reductase
MEGNAGRRVVANISLSLDGRIKGLGGDHDMGWIVPHAVTDGARDNMVRILTPGTTALVGRKNFQGFRSYWPAVAHDAGADPRDRAFATWAASVEKVVFSRTLVGADGTGEVADGQPWSDARVTDVDPAAEVAALRGRPGGDIVVLSSASVIRALLEADEVDVLSIILCPAVVGGGETLLGGGLPASQWTLTASSPTESGAVCLRYERNR